MCEPPPYLKADSIFFQSKCLLLLKLFCLNPKTKSAVLKFLVCTQKSLQNLPPI